MPAPTVNTSQDYILDGDGHVVITGGCTADSQLTVSMDDMATDDQQVDGSSWQAGFSTSAGDHNVTASDQYGESTGTVTVKKMQG